MHGQRVFQIAAIVVLLTQALPAQQNGIEDFFRDFAAHWVRHDPGLKTSTRYFTGEEQDRLRQVNTIKGQMDEVFESLSRVQGTFEERVAKLQADLAYRNPASDASRDKIMKDIGTILRDAQQRSALLFDKRPKAEIVAQPYPKFQEANNAPRSSPPSPDGSRPGIFLFPRGVDWMTNFGLKARKSLGDKFSLKEFHNVLLDTGNVPLDLLE